MNARERFEWACNTPSDIGLHIPKLQHLAMDSQHDCEHVTEFGVRGGVSTSAWLYGGIGTLRCYDIAVPGCLPELESCAEEGGIDFRFIQADTGKLESIEPTDLLFLDTLHTGEHLLKELRHHEQVRKYIVLHDTETNGWIGEDVGSHGLKWALIQFLLKNHTEWRIAHHNPENNGLTVLRRTPYSILPCSAPS